VQAIEFDLKGGDEFFYFNGRDFDKRSSFLVRQGIYIDCAVARVGVRLYIHPD
jgi:hypothetical protein